MQYTVLMYKPTNKEATLNWDNYYLEVLQILIAHIVLNFYLAIYFLNNIQNDKIVILEKHSKKKQ